MLSYQLFVVITIVASPYIWMLKILVVVSVRRNIFRCKNSNHFSCLTLFFLWLGIEPAIPLGNSENGALKVKLPCYTQNIFEKNFCWNMQFFNKYSYISKTTTSTNIYLITFLKVLVKPVPVLQKLTGNSQNFESL